MRTVGGNILILSFALFASAQVAKKCSAPLEYPTTTLDKKFISKQSFKSGEKVYYRCAEDFSPSGGRPFVVCQDGKWSKLTLKCDKRICGNAGDLRNGYLVYEGQTFIGEKVYAKCKKGYVLKGVGFMTCKKSGWSGDFPSCVVGESVPSVVETTHSSVGESVPSVVETTHSSVGESVPSVVETTCSTPSVDNSLQKGGDAAVHRVGDSLSFTCRQDFQLDGPQQITCSPDGQWQPRPPRCLPSPVKTTEPPIIEGGGCSAPEKVPGSHANLIDRYTAMTAFSSGEKVYYTCDVGYSAAGGSRIRKCVNGKWTKLSLKCERKLCGHAGEILNGRFIYTGVEFGDTATAKCNEGFQMIGKATRNCMANGWDGRTAVCEAVVCPEPKVSNAVRKGVQEPPYEYRTTISYQCHAGTLVGSNEIWCTKNGTWSSSPPDCREIGCPSPNVDNAYWMGAYKKMHEPMETISIECIRGYTITEPKRISCSREGKWLPKLPQCVPYYYNWRRG